MDKNIFKKRIEKKSNRSLRGLEDKILIPKNQIRNREIDFLFESKKIKNEKNFKFLKQAKINSILRIKNDKDLNGIDKREKEKEKKEIEKKRKQEIEKKRKQEENKKKIENEKKRKRLELKKKKEEEKNEEIKLEKLKQDSEARIAELKKLTIYGEKKTKLGTITNEIYNQQLESTYLFTNSNSIKLNIDDYIINLLKKPTKIVIEEKDIDFYKIPDQFNSLKNYQNVFVKIFMDEIRSNFFMIKKSKEFLGRDKFKVNLLFMMKFNNSAICKIIISPEKMEEDTYKDFYYELKKNHSIIIVNVKKNNKKKIFFGIKVKRSKKKKNLSFDNLTFQFPIGMKEYLKSDGEPQKVKCIFFTNFTSNFRELKTLIKLPKSSNNQILDKILRKNKLISKYQNYIETSHLLNNSQRLAIESFINGPKIGLIQGPPGTGKSFTLIQLIKSILQNETEDDKKKKILVCTPSNCALDELIDRFVCNFDVFDYIDVYKNIGKSNLIKIIRVGKCNENSKASVLEKNLNNILKVKYNLDTEQIEKNNILMENLLKKQKENKNDEKIKQEILNLEIKIQNKLKNPKLNRFEIKKNMVHESKIIFSTLNSSAQKYMKVIKDNISYLIIDEATQCCEVQTLVPLRLNPKRMILIGDPRQLPSTTFHPLSEKLFFSRSLYERLEKNNFSNLMLKVQYRMIPLLCQFPSSVFYNNKLLCSEKVKKKNYVPEKIKHFFNMNFKQKHLVFINIDGITRKKNNSFYNYEEIDIIYNTILKLINSNIKNYGVISPYKAQVKEFRRKFSDNYKFYDSEVNTVDGFQGKEKDIIFLSCVKSKNENNEKMSIGFLKDKRRLNVSITRAKYGLIVVGNLNTLKKDNLWKLYIEFLEENYCVFDYDFKNDKIVDYDKNKEINYLRNKKKNYLKNEKRDNNYYTKNNLKNENKYNIRREKLNKIRNEMNLKEIKKKENNLIKEKNKKKRNKSKILIKKKNFEDLFKKKSIIKKTIDYKIKKKNQQSYFNDILHDI